MPQLFDTTVRLLSQEPLAGRIPTGEVLRVAEILDGAGFACLEVSGGGVFDASVRRGVESPWERIRAIDARTTTPLGLALRGRFLVGSKPVSPDIVRRFVACAADNGIDIFRLHDPLNDVSNLREAGEAIVDLGKELHVGLVYTSGGSGELDALVEQARRLGELGAARVLLNDPTGGLLPHVTQELVERLGEASGLPVGLYVQAAGGTALANALVATRVGADVVATAVYPLALTLHRIAGESLVEALEGLGRPTGVDVARLWEAADVVDEHLGDEPLAPLAPRIAVRAAEYDLPAGLVAALDAQLRAHGAGDRLLDTLAEVVRIREESGRPPLAAPIGQILGSQAFLNVLSARRYRTVLDEFRQLVTGAYGNPPAAIEPSVLRAVALLGGDAPALDEDPPSADDVREAAEGLASSEEDLVLLAMFGDEAETLLQTIRQRHSREASLLAGDVDAQRGERIRELVRIVQESGVGEIEIEDEGMRVSVRRADEPGAVPGHTVGGVAIAEHDAPEIAVTAEPVRVESPMAGIFYRSPQPGAPPFVEVGDVVVAGQTLCMLEAMKLFNELKTDLDARVRAIHADNGQPVEFGTLLFELEPVGGATWSSRPMFSRVLVANRGEIAVRVIRALRELGIEAVAVYSTADRNAMHVRLADRAVCIGPPPSAESYLRIPSVVAAAQTTGCEAVHPGYGFLAENPAFARACAENDLVFIGPLAGRDGAARRQGDGQGGAARGGRAARAGHRRAPTHARARSARLRDAVGYPVLLKAAAGGGGQGHAPRRRPRTSSRRSRPPRAEAEAAFGDGCLYLEKVVAPARHVEIQVLARRPREAS